MATHEQCPRYDDCGFVKWRNERPDTHILPLPEDGDCGKDILIEYDDGSLVYGCARLNKSIGSIDVEKYGPQTREELDSSFPDIPNNNGRPSRKLVGGGHT